MVECIVTMNHLDHGALLDAKMAMRSFNGQLNPDIKRNVLELDSVGEFVACLEGRHYVYQASTIKVYSDVGGISY